MNELKLKSKMFSTLINEINQSLTLKEGKKIPFQIFINTYRFINHTELIAIETNLGIIVAHFKFFTVGRLMPISVNLMSEMG